MSLAHFCSGMCVSLQAPFYPAEAASKGADAFSYGLVFGVFELVVFLVSPVVGKAVPIFGPSKCFSTGVFVTGLMCSAFGLLDKIQEPEAFIIASVVVRCLEACGNSMFLTASFSLVAEYFPKSVATVFALVETFFGVGLVVGPSIGSCLFHLGGFPLPFLVLGGAMIIQSSVSVVILYMMNMKSDVITETPNVGFKEALLIPRVLLATLAVFTASLSIGFLMTTLEQYISRFETSTLDVGLFFMVYGLSYACPNPFWGLISDKSSPRLVMLVGSVLLTISFSMIGPLPFLLIKPSYTLSMIMIAVAGMGIGALLVSGFVVAQKSAVAAGFPNDLSTYSLVSSIWTSSFALGAFFGPTLAGFFYDRYGFQWSTLLGVGWSHLLTWLTLWSLLYSCQCDLKSKAATKQYGTMDGDEDQFDEIFTPEESSPSSNLLCSPIYSPVAPRCTPTQRFLSSSSMS